MIVALLGVAALSWLWWVHAQDARLLRADPDATLPPGLERSALAAGERVFKTNCVTCHGPGGQGGALVATPNLADRDWLYGEGTVADIEQVITYGVRSHNPKGWNLADMPAYRQPTGGYKVPALKPGEIADLVAFVKREGGRAAPADAAARGQTLYEGRAGCFDCHGGDAKGDPAIGAPNLTDALWLYGGSDDQIAESIGEGRRGVMPAFHEKLPAARLREVALYVHSLSKDAPKEAR